MIGVRCSLTIALIGMLACSSAGPPSFRVSTPATQRDGFRGEPLRLVGAGAFAFHWKQRLTSSGDRRYLPVERARANADPARDRVIAGSSAGVIKAYDARGRAVYEIEVGVPIDAQPAIDDQRGVAYLGATDGTVVAFATASGRELWRVKGPGPVVEIPVLARDALFIVTQDDKVTALARADGEELWSYDHPLPEGFTIGSHSGLCFADGRLYVGLSDGLVVALDPADGRVVWERDTGLEVEVEEGGAPQYFDVETTPVRWGPHLVVASFAGGLMALDPENGSLQWVDDSLPGAVGLAPAGSSHLVVASADEGVVLYDLEQRRWVWRRQPFRGAPTKPLVWRGAVLIGESEGGFTALALNDGSELSRIESGTGFTAGAAVAEQLGFVISNGGALYALRLLPPRL